MLGTKGIRVSTWLTLVDLLARHILAMADEAKVEEKDNFDVGPLPWPQGQVAHHSHFPKPLELSFMQFCSPCLFLTAAICSHGLAAFVIVHG